MKLQHRIPLLQGGPIPPPSNPPSSSRPIIDLKPAELTSDSNMSVFRAWKRQFEAYYIISNMRFLSPTTQHAFLLKNVDHILSRRLVLSTTETTPILPNDDGNLSCFDVLGDYFQEVCPVLIRRQEFFSCRQIEGEDNSSFRDRLRTLAEDGDVLTMKFEDLMCFQYIQGVRDNELRLSLIHI